MKKTLLLALAILLSKEYNLALCGRNENKMKELLDELGDCQLYAECFDITERDREYLCDLICLSVLTLSKGNAIILVAGADKSVGVSVGNEGSLRECELLFNALLGFSDLGELAARYNDSVLINSTDGASYYVLQLMDNVLE